MKKIVYLIIVFILCFLVACNKNHTHKWEQVVINPTCTKDGISYEKCDCGLTQNEEILKAIGHNFVDGYCECGEKENIEYNVIFRDYNNEVLKEEKVIKGNSATPPPAPEREGYIFIGWSDTLTNINSDLVVYAQYEKEKITVGKDKKFTSLEEALDYCQEGDIIYIDKGVYNGAIINKSVEIRGINYNVNPKLNRENETIFKTDIIINASNVIINGVTLQESAKFTFDKLNENIDNIQFLFCKVSNSTVNKDNARNIAPFNLVSNNGFIIKDITIDNCYIEKCSVGRPMAIYCIDVENLIVQNSYFYGAINKDSYNDAIKIDNKENGNAKFGIKGNVVIVNNDFRNYSQYAIWFRQYDDGKYVIENNYFDNVGQTADSHAAINFISSMELENIEIEVHKNTVINGYMLFKIDELNSDVSNIKCNINENIIIYSKGKYFIKNNVNELILNAKGNYYGTDVVDSSMFYGNVEYSGYYESIYDVPGFEKIELLYNTTPYVEIGDSIKINCECYGFTSDDIIWLSSNENIAVVNEIGEVTGLNKGTVEIIAKSNKYNLEKAITVEVYDDIESKDAVEQFVLSIMNSYSNSVTAANSRSNYEVVNPYFYSIYRGPIKYLFEDLEIDTESYKRDGAAPLVNNKVEYITIHDTWALQRTAKGIAEYFLTDITSVHYAAGNDGIYQIIRLTDKAAHAGDSPYRAYALEKTNVLATSENPEITMVDGYFAINGVKTDLRPYTDYEGTIQDKTNYTTQQLTYSGIRCIIGEDGYYYLGKTYFNDTYKTVSNFGGNANSIGIEMESLKGNDFYFTMQRTAKLVAMLLDKFDLTTNDVKMHNYFSGKNCAQLLKNNLKNELSYKIDKHDINDTLWDEFLELCDAELKMIEYSKKYKFEFISSDTTLLTNTGRVISHNKESVCVPYSIKIINIETNQEIIIDSSIIIPGSLDIDQCYIK